MVGWHQRLNGHGFGWTLGVGDGQGGLACCGSWGLKESDTDERQKNTTNNINFCMNHKRPRIDKSILRKTIKLEESCSLMQIYTIKLQQSKQTSTGTETDIQTNETEFRDKSMLIWSPKP